MFFSKKSSNIGWLVVFLGNPGLKYENTRHNAGFMTADALSKDKGVSINRSKFKALVAECPIGDERVLLMKPQTFMNLSGEAVGEAAKFYKIAPEHVLVVSDDVTLDVGKLRIRQKGSAGGHNGLKSIISHLGTDNFPRIKVGVGAPPHPDYDMADWVLSVFKNQDAEDMAAASKQAAKAIESYIVNGAEKTMNLFNRK